ncbi:MAG: glycosyltransferase, partial [Flavobacteriales bacterium]|nr:glycosyltransferase [Flavobacteriales bacterium]
MLDKTSPSVAVVVLNWNGLDHLKTYLPSVLSNTPAWAEMWVADNGSTDGSLEWVSGTHDQRIRTLALGENLGFAEGYNRALNQIKADVFVLLNSDVRIDGPWLEPMLAVMDREGWDVASPRVVQDVNPSFCEHAGAAGGWMDVDGY